VISIPTIIPDNRELSAFPKVQEIQNASRIWSEGRENKEIRKTDMKEVEQHQQNPPKKKK
jgi:hypothetical protein